MLYLVKADGDNLVVPNCKKSKWLNAKIIVTKAGTIPLKDYSSVIYFAIFSKGCHLEGRSSFNFKQLIARLF